MEISDLELLVQGGAIGLALALIGLIYYIIRYFKDRESADRNVLTNHLSTLLKEENISRDKHTEALTKLSESINHFGDHCAYIQKELNETQHLLNKEVDRLIKVKE